MKLTIDQALQRGVEAHNLGNLQEAEDFYRAILQSQPTHPDANHNLGMIAISVNQASAALPLFKSALETNPNIEQFWISYINALINDQQLDTAKKVLKQGMQGKLSEFAANFINAEIHHIMGRLDEAKASYAKVIALKPDHAEAHSNLGNTLQEQGLLKEAVTSYKHAIALKPDYAEAHSNLGNALHKLGRLEEAVANYGQAIAFKYDFIEAHSNLGSALQKLGRLNEAEASYTLAITFKPDYAEAHNNLGNILKKLGRLEAAEASYKQSIALKPDYSEAMNNFGTMLKDIGRLDEAEARYKQSIALKPDCAEAHYNLGVTLQELNRLDQAEASYTQAISLKPDFTDARRNRWLILFGQKRYKAALKDADLCISKGAVELDLTTLYALGRTEEIYGRIETRSKSDPQNISIAAFAAFFFESERKSNANKFCIRPLDLIYFSNLSYHLKESNAYITALIKSLDKVETIWEPHAKATKGGFQTRDINLFSTPSEEIVRLKSIIIKELDSYYSKFRGQPCHYIKKWPSAHSLEGWHVILKQQGHQKLHIHASGWLSGVIYLRVVPPLGKNEGAIEFNLNSENYSNVNSSKLTYQPESGGIVFFPSSLHHRTVPFTTDADRIIISFDLIPAAI